MSMYTPCITQTLSAASFQTVDLGLPNGAAGTGVGTGGSALDWILPRGLGFMMHPTIPILIVARFLLQFLFVKFSHCDNSQVDSPMDFGFVTELGTNCVTSLLEKLLINCQLPLNIQSTRLQLHQNITWFGPLLHVPTKACVTHYTKTKRYHLHHITTVDHSCIFVNLTFFLEETVCHVLWTLKKN